MKVIDDDDDDFDDDERKKSKKTNFVSNDRSGQDDSRSGYARSTRECRKSDRLQCIGFIRNQKLPTRLSDFLTLNGRLPLEDSSVFDDSVCVLIVMT